MNILIVVPAYNEEIAIGAVLDDLKNHGYKNILVINDGSSDNTEKIVQKNKVKFVSHILNRGLGAGLGTAFEYAKNDKKIDVLVTFDSDGQHQAKDILKLIKPILSKKSDVVIGSRFMGRWGSMPIARVFLNLLSNIMTFTFYGFWSSDSQSGLRAFNRKAIDLINIKTDRMEVSSEFYREISRHNLKFSQIPIEAIYTDYNIKNSHQERFAAIKLSFRLFLPLFK